MPNFVKIMLLFYQPELTNGVKHLDADESRHAVKVLRLKEGNHIHVTDGHGNLYEARITDENHRKCGFELLQNHPEQAFRTYRHLVIAPTKNMDRMEWLVEKATEIGVDRISLIKCSNSERTVVKTDRLIKKAVSAMKQSLKATLPQIDEIVSFKAYLQNETAQQKFIAYVDFENPVELQTVVHPGEENVVLIGPEGDFSPEELQMALDSDFRKVSLGTSRLRTETAGLAAVHLLNLFGK
ncbi:16S rRNA (uracil(1498)-N(3))-methyltransferase [Roseivirga pacifica]